MYRRLLKLPICYQSNKADDLVKPFQFISKQLSLNSYWKEKWPHIYPQSKKLVQEIKTLHIRDANQSLKEISHHRVILANNVIKFGRKHELPLQKQRNIDYGIGPLTLAIIQSNCPQLAGHRHKMIISLMQGRLKIGMDQIALHALIKFFIEQYSQYDKIKHMIGLDWPFLKVLNYNMPKINDQGLKVDPVLLASDIARVSKFFKKSSDIPGQWRVRNVTRNIQKQISILLQSKNKILKQNQNGDSPNATQTILHHLTKKDSQLLIQFIQSFSDYSNNDRISVATLSDFVIRYCQLCAEYSHVNHKKMSNAVLFTRLYRYCPINLWTEEPRTLNKIYVKNKLVDKIHSLYKKHEFLTVELKKLHYQREINFNYVLSYAFSQFFKSLKQRISDQYFIIRPQQLTKPELAEYAWDVYGQIKYETYLKEHVFKIVSSIYPQKLVKMLSPINFNDLKAQNKYSFQHTKMRQILNELQLQFEQSVRIMGFKVNFLLPKGKIVIVIDSQSDYTLDNYQMRQHLLYRNGSILMAGYKLIRFDLYEIANFQQSQQIRILELLKKLQLVGESKAIYVY